MYHTSEEGLAPHLALHICNCYAAATFLSSPGAARLAAGCTAGGGARAHSCDLSTGNTTAAASTRIQAAAATAVERETSRNILAQPAARLHGHAAAGGAGVRGAAQQRGSCHGGGARQAGEGCERDTRRPRQAQLHAKPKVVIAAADVLVPGAACVLDVGWRLHARLQQQE